MIDNFLKGDGTKKKSVTNIRYPVRLVLTIVFKE